MKPAKICETAVAMLPIAVLGGGVEGWRAGGHLWRSEHCGSLNSARAQCVSWRVLWSAPRTDFKVTGKQIQ